MQHEIRHAPDFALLRVAFERPGEAVVTEAGAMIARDAAVEMQTSMRGGLGGALKRSLLGGESLFQNTFTATGPGQTLWIAPAPEGDIVAVTLRPGEDVFLQSGAYLASTPGVALDTKWQGARGFFAGEGLFLLRAHGEGTLWFASYGAVHAVDLGPDDDGYIVDTTHLVGFTAGLDYRVRTVGGLRGLFLSGEGIVCEIEGTGRLWIQSRNPGGLAAFLHRFRPVRAG